MSDVAAALREVEAAGAAGRAEAVASASQRQVALTNAAVAQALLRHYRIWSGQPMPVTGPRLRRSTDDYRN
jgi:hypothetical protein